MLPISGSLDRRRVKGTNERARCARLPELFFGKRSYVSRDLRGSIPGKGKKKRMPSRKKASE